MYKGDNTRSEFFHMLNKVNKTSQAAVEFYSVRAHDSYCTTQSTAVRTVMRYIIQTDT